MRLTEPATGWWPANPPLRPRGFTLLELLLVMAVMAIAVAMVSVSFRDNASQRLEEEASRLAALLEGARARSRAMGSELRWQPMAQGFQFQGLPKAVKMPAQWLDERTSAEVVGAAVLRLGPEPIIDAQQVLLRIGDQQLRLGTDGLGPFVRLDAPPAEPSQ